MASVGDRPQTMTAAQDVDDAPGGRRSRRRWLALALGVLILVAGTVAVLYRPDTSNDTDAEQAGTLTRGEWSDTATGVFRGTDDGEVQLFEEWLGAEIDLAVDFSAREDWTQISAPDYLLEEWRGSGRRLVLSVPMLPTDVDGVTIEAGAQGDYDEYFRTLGRKLVEYDLADTVLRIGWEFNLASWPWYIEDADAWTEYFRRIVDQFRQADGQAFRIDWNVNNGPSPVDATDYYPGDEYVDYVGVDAYDVAGAEGTYPPPEGCEGACLQARREHVWDTVTYGGERGLRFWSSFAAEHDKQMSLPEWGLWDRFDGIGGGDNPYFVEQMAAFIADPDNRVGYQAYFENANDTGTHRLMDDLPESGSRFRELFGE